MIPTFPEKGRGGWGGEEWKGGGRKIKEGKTFRKTGRPRPFFYGGWGRAPAVPSPPSLDLRCTLRASTQETGPRTQALAARRRAWRDSTTRAATRRKGSRRGRGALGGGRRSQDLRRVLPHPRTSLSPLLPRRAPVTAVLHPAPETAGRSDDARPTPGTWRNARSAT